MTTLIKFLITSTLLSWSVVAGATPIDLGQFNHQLELKVDKPGQLHWIALPTSVYQGSQRPRQADIAIFDPNGLTLPSMLGDSPHKTETQSSTITAVPVYEETLNQLRQAVALTNEQQQFSLAVSLDNFPNDDSSKIQGYLFDLEKIKHAKDSLRIRWHGQDKQTIYQLRVQTRHDLTSWLDVRAQWGLTALNQSTEQRSELSLERIERYLKISWVSSKHQITIDSAEIVSQPKPLIIKEEYRAKPIEKLSDRHWLYHVDPLIPATEVEIALALPQYQTTSLIYSRKDTVSQWNYLAKFDTYRFVLDEKQQISKPWSGFVPDHQYFRLELSHDYFEGPELVLRWPRQYIYFVATIPGTYHIAFGHESYQRQTSDAIRNMLEAEQYGTEATWLPNQDMELARPIPTQAHKQVDQLLWVILIAALVIIGVMIYRLRKQMRE
jgi:hypothetical protein